MSIKGLHFVKFPTIYVDGIPVFQWYPQSKEILSNLSMKFWYSAFNAQGSRVIIVVVQVRAVKIYVAAAQWRRWGKKRERGDETQGKN
jgi:hypothetical protein